MKYAKIDLVLNKWASQKNLPVAHLHRDDEIRSIIITDKKGSRYQLWIDETDYDNKCSINIWDFKSKSKTFITEFNNLEETLEYAFCELKKYIEKHN